MDIWSYFLGPQEGVQINHGKRDIGIQAIEVLLQYEVLKLLYE